MRRRRLWLDEHHVVLRNQVYQPKLFRKAASHQVLAKQLGGVLPKLYRKTNLGVRMVLLELNYTKPCFLGLFCFLFCFLL